MPFLIKRSTTARGDEIYLVVRKKIFRKKVYLEIRYYLIKDGQPYPLSKGVMIPESLFGDFLLAVSNCLEGPAEKDFDFLEKGKEVWKEWILGGEIKGEEKEDVLEEG